MGIRSESEAIGMMLKVMDKLIDDAAQARR